jgi:type II secretory pathway pseudopilin PulG
MILPVATLLYGVLTLRQRSDEAAKRRNEALERERTIEQALKEYYERRAAIR